MMEIIIFSFSFEKRCIKYCWYLNFHGKICWKYYWYSFYFYTENGESVEILLIFSFLWKMEATWSKHFTDMTVFMKQRTNMMEIIIFSFLCKIMEICKNVADIYIFREKIENIKNLSDIFIFKPKSSNLHIFTFWWKRGEIYNKY